MNSRAKGRRGEIEFAKVLQAHGWPEAIRNLDQFGCDKRDCLNVGATHWQIKRVEKLNIWQALEQAITEAAPTDLPAVAFRRNRGVWFVALEASEFLPLLALKERG